MSQAQGANELAVNYVATNYQPLPVIVDRGRGVHVWDSNHTEYLDFFSSYSVLNFGHAYHELVCTAIEQLSKLPVASRAYHHSLLGQFCEVVAEFTGHDRVLPTVIGAEAVEAAIKISRKWGYEIKGVEPNKANIIVCANNFHGRTTTIVGFSSEPQYRNNFGPFTPGFKIIPFGDSSALRNAIDENTVAFLVEPIQGEGGVNVPPFGYFRDVRKICGDHDVLLVLDEIQTGFGRTGYDLARFRESIFADITIIGKALGGGLVPVSAVAGRQDIMDVLKPGDHGGTFAGYPLGCAVGIKSIELLKELELSHRARKTGKSIMDRLSEIKSFAIKEVRGQGLLIGIEVIDQAIARRVCEELAKDGLLCVSSHNVIRISPPLIISLADADWGANKIKKVFESLSA